MWNKIANYILKYRILNLSIIIILLAFMTFKASHAKMAYVMANTLPDDNPTMVTYQKFLDQYGQDGMVDFIGMYDPDLFQLENFQRYYDFNEKVRSLDGVVECLSVTRIFNLVKDDSIKQFDLKEVVPTRPETQEEVDRIKEEVYSLRLFDGLLFNSETGAYLMMITQTDECVNTSMRVAFTDSLQAYARQYEEETGVKMHLSGMSYIREVTTEKMVNEIVLFTVLSMIIAGVILFLFFKEWRILLSVLTIVIASVGFMFGLMVSLGFKITMLTGVLPPLLIIIGVENSIFMVNKYNTEFTLCRDKHKALCNTIMRIGPANFLTNTTTAVSFASFIITRNELLVPFGILASVCIMLTYVLTMVLLPTFFSYQREPNGKTINRLENSKINAFMEKLARYVVSHKKLTYTALCCFIALCFLGASMMTTSGRVVDDISEKDELYQDMMFFEKNVGGVMPFEISIDTRKPKGILNARFINKISQLQDTIATYPEFSDPLSIAEVVKFGRQAFYNGDSRQYKVPSSNEFGFIMKYIPDMQGGAMPDIITQYMDKDLQRTRISVQMSNITTPKVDSIISSLKPKIEQIFPRDKYDVTLTGSSVVTLQGTNYLIENLAYSLLLAFVIIALLMALTFKNFKMIVISLIPNVIPLLFTAGIMGFTGIPLKMSTLLVFSIALGISVDNTIHYLARYRLQMRLYDNDVEKSVTGAIKETGPSMVYSASILICGFLIFAFSSFGGTKVVGVLVPATLLISLITNIVVLPTLVLTFFKKRKQS